ncbi:MAG: hypothetical protein HY679_09245, partial [Chloroflexi bacterium]|nr:hypothetical protein [Chloroflexota bacterium]
MFKRFFKTVTALVVAVPLIAGGAFATIAVAAPFHPGDSLFAAQQLADQFRLTLTFDPVQRAAFELDLADRRLADLETSIGSPNELMALAYFDTALNQAVLGIAAVPPERAGDLRTRLGLLSARALDVFSRLSVLPTSAPNVLTTAFTKLLAVGVAAVDSAKSGNDLVGITTTDLGITIEGGTASSLNNPRAVPFPANSSAAAHSFFPLTGQHATLVCSSCHVSGVYKSTPDTCAGCHTQVKPADHFAGDCAGCHTTDAWKPAKFDHSSGADCQSCHLNDKPANHFDGQCSACHSTKVWTPATFSHTGQTTCASCHTQNKPAGHFEGECGVCHKDTTNWKNASFDHSQTGGQDCTACHSAPANHFTGSCSSCHKDTTNWKNASFDHSQTGGQDCSACHSAPANHFSGSCSSCHKDTTNWKNAGFDHSQTGGQDCSACHAPPANHFSGTCSSCHRDTTNWKNAGFDHSQTGGQDCSACHNPPANHFSGSCSSCHR